MCNNLYQKNDELSRLLEKSEHETKSDKNVLYDLSMKLEKAKFEIQEALDNNNDIQTKHDVLNDAHKKVQVDLTRTKSEFENLKIELKESKKAMKTKEKETARMTSKIDNLEASRSSRKKVGELRWRKIKS